MRSIVLFMAVFALGAASVNAKERSWHYGMTHVNDGRWAMVPNTVGWNHFFAFERSHSQWNFNIDCGSRCVVKLVGHH